MEEFNVDLTLKEVAQINYWVKEKKITFTRDLIGFCPVIMGRCRADCVCYIHPKITPKGFDSMGRKYAQSFIENGCTCKTIGKE